MSALALSALAPLALVQDQALAMLAALAALVQDQALAMLAALAALALLEEHGP